MAKRLSPSAVIALKEALCQIYWYKSDLKSFIFQCVTNGAVLGGIDWAQLKRQIASDVVDHLVKGGDDGLADLTKLCNSVAELSSFAHLERLEDGATKAAQAKAAVAQLRTMVTPHQQATEDARASIRRQQLAAERNAASASVQAKLADFLRRYQQLVTSQDAQARGYELERLMYEIFRLFDLDPKASFKSRGEQVDGGFSFDGIDYLFEGKWVSGLVALADLDIFRGKLARKLDNTLGLFLSINGFAPAALEARSATREVLLLMDGEDLLAVLESRIGFRDLIMRKRRHAAQTGVTFLSVREMLTA